MPPFFAVWIRWRCLCDGRWELETVHPAFTSPDAAAIFANGLWATGARRLWLTRGTLTVELNDGRCCPATGVVKIWRLGDGPSDVTEDARFALVPLKLPYLSDLGLDGEFEPRQFLVLDPAGKQVDAWVHVDLDRHVVRVTVAPREDVPDQDFPFGRIPQA